MVCRHLISVAWYKKTCTCLHAQVGCCQLLSQPHDKELALPFLWVVRGEAEPLGPLLEISLHTFIPWGPDLHGTAAIVISESQHQPLLCHWAQRSENKKHWARFYPPNGSKSTPLFDYHVQAAVNKVVKKQQGCPAKYIKRPLDLVGELGSSVPPNCMGFSLCVLLSLSFQYNLQREENPAVAMAASSWPSPTSLEFHNAVSLQCQLLASEQRSFPPGDEGREHVCKAMKRGCHQSA